MILWWSLLRATCRRAHEVDNVTRAIIEPNIGPLCRDCKWSSRPLLSTWEHALCRHPLIAKQSTNMVSGRVTKEDVTCSLARSCIECKKEAKHWEGRKSIWELLRKEPKSG